MKRFSILTIALIITFLSTVSISAQAKYMNTFGLELNKPFNVPECSIIKHVSEKTVFYEKSYEDYMVTSDIKSMCFKRAPSLYSPKDRNKNTIKKPLPPLNPNGQITVVVPDSPGYVGGREVTAYMINGNFVGIGFGTLSYRNDAKTLVSDLTEKYGKPMKITPVELQNDYGAKRTAYTYDWELPGLFVSYDGYKGTVTIATATLLEFFREFNRKETEKKKKTPL